MRAESFVATVYNVMYNIDKASTYDKQTHCQAHCVTYKVKGQKGYMSADCLPFFIRKRSLTRSKNDIVQCLGLL